MVFRGVALAAAVGLGVASFGMTPASAAVTTQISLSVAVGPPTQVLTVRGVGFAGSETVDVFLGTTDLALGVTGTDGSLTLPGFTVPASTQPGTVWVTAVGRRSGLAAQAAFRVHTDWPALGFDAARRGNPYENTLAPGTVGGIGRRWSTTVDVGSDGSAVVGGMVYLGGADGFVYALDAATGARRWSFRTGDWVTGAPAVAGGVVYIGSSDGTVYALDAATGAKRWSYPTGDAVESSPAVVGGLVYITSDDGNLYALDAASGTKRWSYATGGFPYSAPALADGLVYVAVDLDMSSRGVVAAVDASTGAPRWTTAIAENLYHSPVVVNGIVYLSARVSVYALNGAAGGVVWQARPGRFLNTPPAVAGGAVFVGSNAGDVWSLDSATGAQRWHAVPGPQSWVNWPTVAHGVLYVGVYAPGSLYAMDAATGQVLWSYSDGFSMNVAPVVADGELTFGSAGHAMYTFDLPSRRTLQVAPRVEPRSLHPDPALRVTP